MCGVGHIDDEFGAYEHLLVIYLLEIHHLLVDLFASELTTVGWCGGETCGGQEVSANQAIGNMEEPFILQLGHAEESRSVHRRFLFGGFLWLLRLFFLLAAFLAVAL